MAEVDERRRRITLHLYDTDISVTILAAEEEYYRKSEKLITGLMAYYDSHLKELKSEKEILYTTMLDIAVRFAHEQERKDAAPYKDVLSKLTAEIEEALT